MPERLGADLPEYLAASSPLPSVVGLECPSPGRRHEDGAAGPGEQAAAGDDAAVGDRAAGAHAGGRGAHLRGGGRPDRPPGGPALRGGLRHRHGGAAAGRPVQASLHTRMRDQQSGYLRASRMVCSSCTCGAGYRSRSSSRSRLSRRRRTASAATATLSLRTTSSPGLAGSPSCRVRCRQLPFNCNASLHQQVLPATMKVPRVCARCDDVLVCNAPGAEVRKFVAVPEGATWAELRLRAGSYDANRVRAPNENDDRYACRSPAAQMRCGQAGWLAAGLMCVHCRRS